MGSDSKSKDKKSEESKSESKTKTKEKSSSRSHSGSGASSRLQGAGTGDPVHDALVLSCLESHAGYLRGPILSLSTLLFVPPTRVLIGLGTIFFLAHLYVPLFLLPHLSATVTLVIPIQATVAAIGQRGRGDAAQWLFFWMIYCVTAWGRGAASLWRPGYKGVYEVGRSAVLITVGGGWFGRAALRPEKSRASTSRNEQGSLRGEHGKDSKEKEVTKKTDAERKKELAKKKAKGK